MNIHSRLVAFAAAASILGAVPAFAQEEPAHVKPATAYVQQNLQPWLSDPVVIAAVVEANKKHKRLMQEDIIALDKAWVAKDPAVVDPVRKNELSEFLIQKRDASGGVVTEVFVMDNRGLNVGQTDGTSDLWQGDEAKWQKTYGVGPGAIFVDKVEEDGGKKIAQVSAVIVDKDVAIGAVTFGIDVDKLK
ncbi:hypothetical protein KHC23_12380 [Ancylobacter dichloromethanicus]|uniref:Uncharacterized protein n=1 Tax=Ancylobacter dichloromethanicus TaxID=518825 RepID=A0A9W6MYX0_9HYPH|nr:hypothetical protein [Ancylobacter dichloromethanicus]MBS7554449.1 hypothetical protein [Ancylobacter dichloromethanicus]GLK71578.1 hypothetical protein GCM10017643_16930 [Ancylobacter dichloromethanicus]